MPSPPSYGCCTRVNFVLKKHLLFQMNLSNSGLKNRSIKEYWLIFTVLKFPLGLQFSHNLSKFKIIKYISTIYIMTTTCTYLQQLTQVSDVAHGPLVFNISSSKHIQSTLVISKSKGPAETLRDIRTSTYQMCRTEENSKQTTKFHKCTCNLTPLIRKIC